MGDRGPNIIALGKLIMHIGKIDVNVYNSLSGLSNGACVCVCVCMMLYIFTRTQASMAQARHAHVISILVLILQRLYSFPRSFPLTCEPVHHS